jgi:hypothetical protein
MLCKGWNSSCKTEVGIRKLGDYLEILWHTFLILFSSIYSILSQLRCVRSNIDDVQLGHKTLRQPAKSVADFRFSFPVKYKVQSGQ